MSSMKAVKPILSLNHTEARRRALDLYRLWYRQLPFIIHEYGRSQCHIPRHEMYEKLRSVYTKYKHIEDLRVIDLLIFKVNLLSFKLNFNCL